jgi:antitoxin component YwqK of YwqJK toxin-antitoxin module
MHINWLINDCFFGMALLLIVLASCNGDKKKVVSKFRNGNPQVVFEYSSTSDTTKYKIVEYTLSGNIAGEAFIDSGKYVGIRKAYYENGKVKEIDSITGYCAIGIVCNGIVLSYYPNGKIHARLPFESGAVNGVCHYYDTTGALLQEYVVKDNTVKNGYYSEFHKNGVVRYQAAYRNDTIVGYVYFFSENGDTLKYYNHLDGIMRMPYKKWLEDGRTLVGNYVDTTEKAVLWRWYDKNGKETKRKILYPTKSGFVNPE